MGTIACAAPGQWNALPSGDITDAATAITTMSKAKVVLLGESHNRADHHQWQLHTLAGLYGQNANIAVGFEMFPRKSQAALDDWSAGKTDKTAFLEASRWNKVWRFNPNLYMPLLDFVRLNRLPAKALNVERELNKAIVVKGWDQIPEDLREGVSDPATPPTQYVDWLFDIFKDHLKRREGSDEAATEATMKADPEFVRFVESQTLWDRAMAEALAESLDSGDVDQVVGIIGSGHVAGGYGVAHQLRDLGIDEIAMAIPVDGGEDCDSLESHDADFVFVTTPTVQAQEWRPLLGVMLDQAENGVRILNVLPESVAEKTGLKKEDVLIEVAGLKVSKIKEAIAIVRRQAPGTWLPLSIRRGTKEMEFVAKFPTAP